MSITHADIMMTVIHDLLREHTPPTAGDGPEPAPAMECVVRLRSGLQITGALSTVDRKVHDFDREIGHREVAQGTLRMAMPAMAGDPNNPRAQIRVIAEHFFDYEDVEAVIVLRPVDPARVAMLDRPVIVPGR